MREMKDSGIEWIGEIPYSWKISKIKHHFKIGSGTTPKSDDPDFWDGDIVWVTPADFKTDDIYVKKGHRNLSEYGFKMNSLELIPVGNIIFSKRAPVGQVVINKAELCTNQGCLTAIPFDESDVRFYRYLMIIATEEFELVSSGTTFKEISATNFGNIQFPTPDIEHQRRIAGYLDKKCTLIDSIIAKQEAIIEKLKEYKLSVITEAVTKGLNPDVEMKDSGVEWIGELPVGWTVGRLGTLFDFIGGYAFSSDDYVTETDYQVIRIGNIKNDSILLDSNPVYVSSDKAASASKFEIRKGYILFTMTGTKGKRDYFYTCLVTGNDLDKKNLFINQRVGAFVSHKGVCPGYYNYLLKETRILDSIFLYETGTANQGNLGIDSIRRTRVQIPPLREQEKITDYLDGKCTNVNKNVDERKQIIEKLKEYKKSLIYEVVTGKKEV